MARWTVFWSSPRISPTENGQRLICAAKDSAERAKAAAEQANRAKDYFLAILSHELRTPLTPVLMGVSMLQRRPDLDQDLRETLEMVRRNVEMEAWLIDDLLDLMHIARGTVELHKQRADLCTVIGYAVEVCRPDIEMRGLEFAVDMGPDAPYWVEADIARLQQVFWNLLKNAIKFTPRGGCVGIRCRLDGPGQVVAEVHDSGIGIDPEVLPRLFNAFEQADRSIRQQYGGLGLGLAISKAMAEMHGGSIAAYSEGRGKGATFRVRLPLTISRDQLEVRAPTTPQSRAIGPWRVLLVEDHDVTAKIIRLMLMSEGHAVETAGDVATALKLAREHRFDLLISDLGLPDGSGHDLMRKLRSQRYIVPGIALSGYGQEEDIQRSREAGFFAHLTKPVPRERLVEAIVSVIAGQPMTSATEPTNGPATLRFVDSMAVQESGCKYVFLARERSQNLLHFTLGKKVPCQRRDLPSGQMAGLARLSVPCVSGASANLWHLGNSPAVEVVGPDRKATDIRPILRFSIGTSHRHPRLPFLRLTEASI